MNNDPIPELHEDAALAGLLREAGRRPEPGAAVEAAVRAAATAEWRRVVAEQAAARRRRQRSWLAAALAAGVAAVAVVVWREAPGPVVPAPQVAGTVSRAIGPVQFAAATSQHATPQPADGQAWESLGERVAVPAGSVVATGPGGRVAIELAAGGTVRLDEATRVAFTGTDGLALEQGAVYFDTGAEPGAAADFVVSTRRGVVRHVGTQYQVRAGAGDGPVAVSIREGRVAVTVGDSRLEVPAGERLVLLADGSASRMPVGPTDAEWHWTQAVAPGFDIESRPLTDFLAWVSRETGATVEFDSPGDRDAAAAVRLKGSVRGLTPDQALRAVMATTRFEYRLEGARLAVARRP